MLKIIEISQYNYITVTSKSNTNKKKLKNINFRI